MAKKPKEVVAEPTPPVDLKALAQQIINVIQIAESPEQLEVIREEILNSGFSSETATFLKRKIADRTMQLEAPF